ncbi:MAG: SEC-C metal-binding domain-containing protein [Thermodesulfobacteriota bacterium]|nr:SEC-C metal-binding domain-containing protein [Thermodesulfobacteriota bacterium]
MKTGRNTPCPCGSGKKFKKCCISKSQEDTNELLWRSIGKVNEELTNKILPHTIKHYGKGAIHDAWEEFISDPTVPFDPKTHLIALFMPWFLYNWYPDEYGEVEYPPDLVEDQPALFFLKRQRKRLSPLECAYIEASIREPLTFWEVVDSIPGKRFTLKDIFLDRELSVIEKSASQNVQKGDILFGKCVTIEDLTTLEACGHFIIQPIHKIQLINLREKIERDFMPTSIEDLLDYDLDLIQVFLDIEHLSYNPEARFQNTDGDNFIFNKVIFDIVSAQQAFDSLKHLAGNMDENDLLKNAERDEAGQLTKVRFNWIGQGNKMIDQWETTILGDVILERSRLTIHVNSVQRANRIKKIIGERLPGAKYKATVIETVEAQLKDRQSRVSSPEVLAEKKKRQEIEAIPEVQEAINKMLRAHYETWMDKELPALEGKTPRQAIKTKDGREKVDALLLHLERSQENGPALPEGIIKKIRQELNLY